MDFYEQQLRQQYRLLRHEGYFTQCHAQDVGRKSLVQRRLVSNEKEVIEFAKENNGRGNVFVGRNPRDKDGNVIHATCLTLDIDPVRPKDTAATEEQAYATLGAGRRLVQHFGHGVLCSSGNGALVIFSIPDTPIADAQELGKRLENQARAILKGEPVNVDATWDAPRLVKVLGCLSTKGDPSMWRYARFISQSRPYSDGAGFVELLKLSVSEGFTRKTALPEVSKGELDRSKADISLANRLKLQGFSAGETLTALEEFGFRPDREDDHKRIIGKVFSGSVRETDGVSGRNTAITLWTPENGAAEYNKRNTGGRIELPTGFAALDAATFGLVRGSIYTVGARTGCGKTTFAVSASVNLCAAGKSVLYLSTETTYQEVWDRYFAAATGVSAFNIQNGLCDAADNEKIRNFRDGFNSHRFFVYDGSRPSAALIKKIIEQQTPDVLVLDYFQHIDATDTRALESFIMDLHDLAKERNFAVLACAQLHGRLNPATGKQYPVSLQDVKNSKVLSDESRTVLLLDWTNEPAQGDGAAIVKGVMAKNRGPRKDVVMRLDRKIPCFTEEK